MSKIKLPNSIKMVITDFDGILTDNCVYINEDFTMSRKLNFKDIMGLSRLRKIDVLKSIIERYNLSQEDYLYIGDDINDLECLKYAKYKISVPHAVDAVKNIDDIQITSSKAGDGAFREVADCLIG